MEEIFLGYFTQGKYIGKVKCSFVLDFLMLETTSPKSLSIEFELRMNIMLTLSLTCNPLLIFSIELQHCLIFQWTRLYSPSRNDYEDGKILSLGFEPLVIESAKNINGFQHWVK